MIYTRTSQVNEEPSEELENSSDEVFDFSTNVVNESIQHQTEYTEEIIEKIPLSNSTNELEFFMEIIVDKISCDLQLDEEDLYTARGICIDEREITTVRELIQLLHLIK
jgi:hypothetical protein